MKTLHEAAKPKLAIVAASPFTVNAFLLDHIRALAGEWEITVYTAFAEDLKETGTLAGARAVRIRIEREVAPLSDLRAIAELWAHFVFDPPDVVHSHTPKGGLAAMLAGRLARVPVRIHTFTGQVWVTRRGLRRALLKRVDRLIGVLATHVLTDSQSQLRFLREEEVIAWGEGEVLGEGSFSGVDVDRFRPDASARDEFRGTHGIDPEAVLIIFVGRLKRDKGVLDLVEGFRVVAEQEPRAMLLLVGPDEEGLRELLIRSAGRFAPRVRCLPETRNPERVMQGSDILCLPSYREGFGSVLIEANACELPVVGSNIYGVSEAVVAEKTGLLFEAGNTEKLAGALSRLIGDQSLRTAMGKAGRARAVADFSRTTSIAQWRQMYRRQPLW
jgi:glycosyltransferase involved in cell wall biosynthesis